ncbi:MAG: YggS family pyridoxal phosphate-dependent enzyme [Bacteroidetes bacterium]|nr:MAG: YggS family pyridoxal phosphate-dependent enzyme [Bacteroidota bacterium]
MSISENLKAIQSDLPSSVTLVAISKTKPVSAIQEALEAGQIHFGENKVQEMTDKHAQLPESILWHQVGHLQSNKVKYLAPYVHLIHSIDSLKLLQEVNKQASKHDRNIQVLLQMHIAEEETKFGLDSDELKALLEHPDFASLTNITVSGLMGMATFTENEQQIAKEFRGLRKLYDEISAAYSSHHHCNWTSLSMGMSGDYKIAVKEGSTMVRVGSAIFGNRVYS